MNAFMDHNDRGLAFIAAAVLFATFLWLRLLEIFWGSFALAVIAVAPTLSKLTAGFIILEFKNRVAQQISHELGAQLTITDSLEDTKIPAGSAGSDAWRRQLIDRIIKMRLPKAETPEAFGHEIVEVLRLKDVVARLYREYILSHDGISPAIMAGTAPLPDDWVHEKLKEWGLPSAENPTRS